MDLLVAVESSGERTLHPGDRLTVGRGGEADICVDNQRISRRHLLIEGRDGSWWVNDAGSSNGIFDEDGAPVDVVEIDRVRFIRLGGPHGIEVRLEPVAPPTQSSDVGRETVILDDFFVAPNTGSKGEVVFPTVAGQTVRIGRENADIVIDDLLVSRRHAEIEIRGPTEAEVRDLKSSNGTYLDGRRVSRARFDDRSVLTIGRTNLVLRDGRIVEHHDDGQFEFVVESLEVVDPSGRPIVRDVSFEVPPHSLVGVLGPSGAGKSTVIKSLVGAVTPSGGRVFYGGVDLLDGISSTRRRIGYVPQDDILHGGLSVERSLAYAARLRFSEDATDAEISQRISEVLDQLGLSAHRKKRVDRLSGGQRKRASTAMELLTRPPLLMLDEPSSGLDPGNEKALMELLRDIAHEESDEPNSARRVLVVTHSVQSLDLCDLVLVLVSGTESDPGGRIAFFGRPAELLEHFGVEDAADVFRLLEADPAKWSRAEGLAVRPRESRPTPAPGGVRERPPLPRRRQLRLLVRRYLDVLWSDKPNLWLLAFQAPVVGLMLALITRDAFVSNGLEPASGLPVLMLGLVLSMTYIAASNSVRELVKERAIFQRERALGVDPAAHVGAKVIVLGALTMAQSIVLVFAATARAGPLDAEPLLGLGFIGARVELVAVVVLSGLAAVGLGLFISAIVANADKAMSVLPVLLLAMYLVSGGPTDVSDSVVLSPLSWINSAWWGLSGAAQVTDAEALLWCADAGSFPGIGGGCRPSWERGQLDLLFDMGALAALSAGFVAGAILVLRRQRP